MSETLASNCSYVRLVGLLAQRVPIGIRVVEETPARRREVVEHDARVVVGCDARLPGGLQVVRQPVGAVPLIIEIRFHVERLDVFRRAAGFRVHGAQPERNAQRSARFEQEPEACERVFRPTELLRAAPDIPVLAQ